MSRPFFEFPPVDPAAPFIEATHAEQARDRQTIVLTAAQLVGWTDALRSDP